MTHASRGIRRFYRESRPVFFGVALLAACGGSSPLTGGRGTFEPLDGGSATDAAQATSEAGPLFGSDSGGAPSDASDDCPEAAKLVYVTGVGAQLWSFYPPMLKFTLIGTLSCLSNPTHMTVDRQGAAWVVASGRLYKASTADATCGAVPTWSPHVANFADFALTFVGTSNAVDNTLYLMGTSTLGKFDVSSGAVTTIAAAPAANAIGDMTSNGDGTLYFLYDRAPPTLYDLDTANGSVLSSSALSATGGGAQALAFWGGAFYAFENNVIYQYDPIKKTTTSLGKAPLTVTGAGQSTCVPKTMPPPR